MKLTMTARERELLDNLRRAGLLECPVNCTCKGTMPTTPKGN